MMGRQLTRGISEEDKQARNEKLRKLKAEGMTDCALAIRFGISPATVAKILKGLPTKS
jgi:transcriptional regulator with XRE-family HTH domain